MLLCLLLVLKLSNQFWGVTPAKAWPPTFSREHNATTEELLEACRQRRIERLRSGVQSDWILARPDKAEHLALQKFVKAMDRLCEGCTKTSIEGKWGLEYHYGYPSGGGIRATVDSCVVEVYPDPEDNLQFVQRMDDHRLTLRAFVEAGLKLRIDPEAQLRRHFERLEQAYLEPIDTSVLTETEISKFKFNAVNEEVSHLNIGVRSAFGDDVETFVRFIYEWNVRHFAEGALLFPSRSAISNAPRLKFALLSQQRAFATLIQDIQSGQVKTIAEAARRMNREVYKYSPVKNETDHRADPTHYQAVGLKFLKNLENSPIDLPMELRMVRQPQSAEEDLALRNLIQARIAHLQTLKGQPIYFLPRKPEYDSEDKLVFYIESDFSTALDLYFYLAEMGKDWSDYRILWPDGIIQVLDSVEFKRMIIGIPNWASQIDRTTFKSAVVGRFYVSEWMREHVLRVCRHVPVERTAEIIQYLLDEYGDYYDVLEPFLERLYAIQNFKTKENHKLILDWIDKQSGKCGRAMTDRGDRRAF